MSLARPGFSHHHQYRYHCHYIYGSAIIIIVIVIRSVISILSAVSYHHHIHVDQHQSCLSASQFCACVLSVFGVYFAFVHSFLCPLIFVAVVHIPSNSCSSSSILTPSQILILIYYIVSLSIIPTLHDSFRTEPGARFALSGHVLPLKWACSRRACLVLRCICVPAFHLHPAVVLVNLRDPRDVRIEDWPWKPFYYSGILQQHCQEFASAQR